MQTRWRSGAEHNSHPSQPGRKKSTRRHVSVMPVPFKLCAASRPLYLKGTANVCFSFPKACWVFGPNILLLMCRAQSLPATLRNDGTYSLPWGWAMDTRSSVHGQDIHPSLAQETGGAGYSNPSLNSRKSLCPPMGSATLPCCPHAFTVLSRLASQPPRLR